MFELVHTADLLDWVKRVRHSNCADKYDLIELSDLIGFGYDLSDTQASLKCWIMGFIFCDKHPLLLKLI